MRNVVKDWIKTKRAKKKAERIASEIVVWMSNNSQATMFEFTNMMEGYGFYITGYSIAGDKIVFCDGNNCQIDVCMAVEREGESEPKEIL